MRRLCLASRPKHVELEHCRKPLDASGTLVAWRLDRLGRLLSDLVKIIVELEQGDIAFESLSEEIDMGSALGMLQFNVLAALAEFERYLIRERTLAGIIAAPARGRVGGRKPKLNDKQIREIRALLAGLVVQVKDIAARYSVSHSYLDGLSPVD
jgi:DNA invertase Pin-like site-specific DNA recombinase